ncbi:hypothetical protein ABZX85_30455 [Streptomyces sp. NPDC004539]|uniref:hypothetical protein n=1 Tax=Streptomyces sp. NPDC004539 TaxID=3154280 RepID=UPI0033A5EF7E
MAHASPPDAHPVCRHCSFNSVTCDRNTAAELLLYYAAQWRRVLTGPADLTRPGTGTPAWSTLEHGCHVRDMCLLFHQQLGAMLDASRDIAPSGVSTPLRYRDEDARHVADELERAATALAARLTTLTADEWDRGDPRLPDLDLTLGVRTRHLLHDICHSLHGALRATRQPAEDGEHTW